MKATATTTPKTNKTTPENTGEPSSVATLRAYIDSLDVQNVWRTSDAELLDLCHKYGPAKEAASLEAYAVAQLHSMAVRYKTETTPYVKAGRPGYSVPAFMTEEPKYQKQPPSWTTSFSLGEWLKVVGRINTIVAGDVAVQLADLLAKEFRADAFDAELDYVTGRRREAIASSMKSALRRMGEFAGSMLAEYATDAKAIHRYTESSYFNHFGREQESRKLHARLVELEGAYTKDGGRTPAYQTVIELLGKDMAVNGVYANDFKGMSLVAEHTPELVNTLIKEFPMARKRLVPYIAGTIINKPLKQRTSQEEKLLGWAEARMSTDFIDNYALAETYMHQVGSLSPEHAATLARLMAESKADKNYFDTSKHYGSFVGREDLHDKYSTAQVWVSLFIGDKDLVGVVRGDATYARVESSRAIIVRRLAQMGKIHEAIAFVGSIPRAAEANKFTSAISDLIAIYEESGSKHALSLAEKALKSRGGKKLILSGGSHRGHALALKQYAAGVKQGNTKLAAAARVAIDTIHAGAPNWQVRDFMIDAIQMFVGLGDTETASEYAHALSQITPDVKNGQGDPTSSSALLTIVEAYAVAGKHKEATAYMQEHLMQEKQPNSKVLWGAAEHVLSDEMLPPASAHYKRNAMLVSVR